MPEALTLAGLALALAVLDLLLLGFYGEGRQLLVRGLALVGLCALACLVAWAP